MWADFYEVWVHVFANEQLDAEKLREEVDIEGDSVPCSLGLGSWALDTLDF